ncbi:site-specific recombinase Gcr [Pseudopedobacter saltans DSM 12145]|uniref:Site-specific recombinase Gcr n=2 Tax=Pseudopedobacter saltans TaxID=151895 RepID=F0S7R2_PSESL|nr:site-specific recombinase Gcr [Pseudopedobacter saltans DSM 12145]
MVSRFNNILDQIVNLKGAASSDQLIELVKIIRPYDFKNAKKATESLVNLIDTLKDNPVYQQAFSRYIISLLKSKNQIRLFAELGISPNTNFLGELRRRLNAKILPPAIDNSELTDLLLEVFNNKNDHYWVEGVADDVWKQLFSLIDLPKSLDLILPDLFYMPIVNSVLILTNRISSLGLEPEIAMRMPHVEKYHSDFLALSSEVHNFLNAHKQDQQIEASESLKQVRVLLTQCLNSIDRIRKSQKNRGTSIAQVYILLRITQNIKRLQQLLNFLDPKNGDSSKQLGYSVQLFKKLVYAENMSKSVRSHIKENTDLLAYQIIEHTSSVGKKYVAVTKKEYFSAIWAAMKGGFIIVLAVLVKAYIGNFKDLPLVPSTFLYGLNYATAFVIIYLTHSSLATKQPSMTASYIANALSGNGKGGIHVNNAADTIIRMFRSQFASVVGNLIVVVPLTFLFAYSYFYITGEYFFSRQHAITALEENNPFESLMIIYAAIAGFFLFLSGLITGYYENKIVTSQIPKRIREHKYLSKKLGQRRLNIFASFVEKNTGSLAGNIILGFLLGSAGPIGKITGLPFDIRHITISAGNYGLGSYTLLEKPIVDLMVYSAIGVLLVGVINITVSFALTMIVAVKSLRVDYSRWGELVQAVFAHFIFSTRDFFYPPKEKKNTNFENQNLE